MENQVKQTWQTDDFYLSAFCLASGVKLADLDKSNPRQIFFVFNDFKGRENLERDFIFGRTTVDPKKYAAAIKELKNLMYSNG
ncbi:MAG: hypothetical protein HYR90_03675 [Candidatus Andersenbacteria bacterium]|nr:hypothetical protein [Candidatus Andersenbacteria bacterium]MBI3250364.1 hypothetical protein [Candidatus Andersenbacteria bacterium]